MDGETLWNQVLSELTPEGAELQTLKRGLWFSASTDNGKLYVDKAKSNQPSSKLSIQRPISKKDFLLVYTYYDRWKNKETGVRQEVSNKSQNTAYIFALIEKYM